MSGSFSDVAIHRHSRELALGKAWQIGQPASGTRLCVSCLFVCYKQKNALIVNTMLLDLVSSEHAVLLQIYIQSIPGGQEALCLHYLKGLL